MTELLPELLLLAGAVAALGTGLAVPRGRQWTGAAVAVAFLLAALGAAGWAAGRPDATAFDAFTVDTATHVTRLVVLGATVPVVALAAAAFHGHPRETEFTVLALLSSLGTILLGASSDLLVLTAAFLLASIPAYALAGFAKDAAGTEAALKYYLTGALFGIVTLAGTTVLYGLGGSTSYAALHRALPAAPPGAVAAGAVAVAAGLLFKAGAAPGHFWVPDVAEGASPVAAAYVTTIPKAGALVALFRLTTEVVPDVPQWPPFLAAVAAATMTLGNLAAFRQANARRLLGYSTVGQAGFLLLPVVVAASVPAARAALLFYLAAYAVTNLAAFAVVVATGRDALADYAGLFRASPALALCLAVALLGLVGTPPTGVFVGKFLAFAAAMRGGYGWLAALAVVNTVASVFYYLRWLAPTLAGRFGPSRGRSLPGATACAAAVAAVALGVLGGIVR
ncbi:NADH-quinone oxidoreductase subunit N [Actinomadura atramentaria]|uniref:NADH-quinone oxidoreductase subunit N n=1 Tax=Actinomadura atramentaria TaxID=1990 RepID=UPI00036A0980|nr:proton-conducting transporter membrane subunit [Actinomadura atramentaria]